jgi:hypothetical protein
MYQYRPEIPSDISIIDFRAYMIESAYKYYMTAIKSSYDDLATKSVICALAIEIILKSYNSETTNNEGRIDENYSFKKPKKLVTDAHDLLQLANIIPLPIQRYLFSESELEILKDNKDLFKSSRYLYEDQAKNYYSDDIIDLSCELICKTILLYKSLGCTDIFITYTDVDDIYFSHKRRFM